MDLFTKLFVRWGFISALSSENDAFSDEILNEPSWCLELMRYFVIDHQLQWHLIRLKPIHPWVLRVQYMTLHRLYLPFLQRIARTL